MDTKLTSNGERPEVRDGRPGKIEKDEDISGFTFFEEELLPERIARRHSVNSMLLLALGIMTTLFSLFGAMDISSFSGRNGRGTGLVGFQEILWDSSGAAWAVKDEILRYSKNLQRFFIHYEDFDLDGIQEDTAVSTEEIRQLRMENEILYQREVREITERYNQEINAVEEGISQLVDEYSYRGAEGEYFDSYSDGVSSAYSATTRNTQATFVLVPEITIKYGEYQRLINERDSLITAAGDRYMLSDEEYLEIIEKNRQEDSVYDISNYYEIKSYLENTSFLRYCLKRAKDSGYITNIPDSEWAKYETPLQYVEDSIGYYISVQDGFFDAEFNGRPLNEWFKTSGISGYIFITPAYGGNNPIAAYFSERAAVDSMYMGFILAVLSVAILGVIAWTLFIKSDKESVRQTREFAYRLYKKLPLAVKSVLLLCALLAIIICAQSLDGVCYGIFDRGFISWASYMGLSLLAATAAVLYILLCLSHLWYFVKKPSIILDEPEIRLFQRLFGNVGLVYSQKVTSISLSLSLLLFLYILVQLLAVAALLSYGLYSDAVLLFLIYQVVLHLLVLYVFSMITALAKTNKYMDAIISGDLELEINEKGGYKTIINKLNRVRGGVRRVVVEKNKSEKMKTDLITNVSHDLKTPLTSIINYVELLKSPQLSEADRAEYIDVLDKKSQRVKLLIDDLFEATKLSSGQITLDRSEIDIVHLLKQAVGELEEKFMDAGITLKLTYSKESIPVLADGKKLWRVFENLFTNIIKYAQPGTRAYVNINESCGYAELVFKNVSFYELNFEYDELFERGKRGDVARTTEGSGLGLSIAKDIVELHEGSMDISIDGDLFKVIVRLPAM